MLNDNIRSGRGRPTGTVNFTMMYVAHDAFTRGLHPSPVLPGPVAGAARRSCATAVSAGPH